MGAAPSSTIMYGMKSYLMAHFFPPLSVVPGTEAKVRSGEMDESADVYRLAQPYYPQEWSKIKGYALTYMVVCPDACRYATIDHILGDRADHSLGMLHSVSTSENSRIERMARAKGGYAAVQRLYAATFPAPAATA